MAMLSSKSSLKKLGPKFKTNADVFAKAGNPLNGQKRNIPAIIEPLTDLERMVDERRRQLGMPSLHYAAETRERYRTEETPEFDQYFCDRAKPRREAAPEARQQTEATPFRKVVGAKARNNIARHSKQTVKVDAPPSPVVTSAGEKSSPAEFSLYVKYEDGREAELDRRGRKTAEKSFDRYAARKDTVAVELWSYTTGECLKQYERNVNDS